MDKDNGYYNDLLRAGDSVSNRVLENAEDVAMMRIALWGIAVWLIEGRELVFPETPFNDEPLNIFFGVVYDEVKKVACRRQGEDVALSDAERKVYEGFDIEGFRRAYKKIYGKEYGEEKK